MNFSIEKTKFQKLNLNYKINTKIFKKENKEGVDLNRISYISISTLMANQIFNESWKVIKYKENKTLTFVEYIEDDLSDSTIYINPNIAQFLQLPKIEDEIEIYDLYDEMSINQIKFSYNKNEDFRLIHNIPIIKKIKIKMLNDYSKHENYNFFIKEKVLNYFKKEKVISLNEMITISDNNLLDPFYGIFTNKNDFFYFIISEIEYENYDNLRSFIKDGNLYKTYNTSKDKNELYKLNAFLIPNDNLHLFDIEIIKNDYNYPIGLIKQNLRFINNLFIQGKNYDELINQKFYQNIYSNLKNNILLKSTIFTIGPIHSGINYLIKNICDDFGLCFIKKDLNKFRTFEKFINYIKKLEFKTPCVINFKNCKKLTNLICTNENSQSRNYIDELKEIINIPRHISSDAKLVFIFSFESSIEIDKSLKSLSDIQIEYNLPDIKMRIDLFKIGFKNILENTDNIFNNKLAEKIKKSLNKNRKNLIEEKTQIDNIKQEIEKLNYFEIAKLTVGYDIKEIKTMIKTIIIEFTLNDNNNLNFDNNFIKSIFTKLKKNRIKSEKTISSIPEVKWEDVGGLDAAKDDINDTIQLPLKYPKLFENSLKRRSGLLLYGPPGSGKTLLAKAIANECSMNFISVKGPELLNMYVGESEKNIREVFERARGNRPCAIFFDEIDALAPARTKNSDQNNVMDRIVAQFMTEMDGLTKENDLIIVASTNRPDLVDPSLLRPGRFDKMIYVGLPQSINEKIKIFEAQTFKLNLRNDVDLKVLAELSKDDYSGADIYAVCSLAFTLALKEKIRNNELGDVIVGMIHFREALDKISPSLSKIEINKYEELKMKYSQ